MDYAAAVHNARWVHFPAHGTVPKMVEMYISTVHNALARA